MPQAHLQADAIGLPISREQVEAQIDLLIDLLDALDDPDTEPSLGWTAPSNHWLETPEDLLANANAGDDREDEDDREPPEDSEPSLGWTHTVNQTATDWAANNLGVVDMEQGAGAIRKVRPESKTGNSVRYFAEVLA